MKYSKGDKVRIRNIDWYENMLSIPSKLVWQNKLTEDFIGIWCGSHVFRKEMREFCGMVMTIQEVGIDCYLMEEDRMGYEFTDEMIEDVVMPKFKINDKVETNDDLFGYIDEIKYDEANKCYMYYVSFIVDGGYYYENQLKLYKKESDSNVEDIVNSHYEDEIEEMVKSHRKDLLNDIYNLGMENSRKEAVKLGISEHIVCPEGYEFRDGDGNLIAVDKIVLVKKGVNYPKSYKECFDIMYIGEPLVQPTGYWHKWGLLAEFSKLLLCRDAYWKIYGEEMGLDKPWEPDDGTDIYNIYRLKNTIHTGGASWSGNCNILEFPTAEMRDAFYEAFKELIEECKELL